MTIITEIDLKFKSGNDVQVQDARISREEWLQVKSYIEGVRTGAGACSECRQPLDTIQCSGASINGFTFMPQQNGVCVSCQAMQIERYMRRGAQ